MYCRECGEKFINDVATVCLSCGVKKGNGIKYCDGCGEKKKSERQDVCLSCGKDFKRLSLNIGTSKTKLITLLLWFFVGGFGGHCFYVGRTGQAIAYICLTLGGFITFGITSIIAAIMLIIDVIRILTDKFEDSNGILVTQWT